MIDLIDSRECFKGMEWFKTYKNLNVVSRDGSISYASAMTQAHPKAIQVTDRFHLLKNLTDAAKSHLLGALAPRFYVTLQESIKKGEKQEYFQKEAKESNRSIQHKKNAERKANMVEKVCNLKKEGDTISAIHRETGLCRTTIYNYLSTDFNPSCANYGRNQNSKIKLFTKDIENMVGKGKTFLEIEQYICEEGYDGAASTIRMYTMRERVLRKNFNVKLEVNQELVERQWVMKLLYKPIEKIREITKELWENLFRENPMIGKLLQLVQAFRKLLSGKDVKELENWMTQANCLNIDSINRFTNGVRRDIEAVKNAIQYEYNNGLAEGSVNKLKVIKRIMYGRNSFKLLRNKVLYNELMKTPN